MLNKQYDLIVIGSGPAGQKEQSQQPNVENRLLLLIVKPWLAVFHCTVELFPARHCVKRSFICLFCDNILFTECHYCRHGQQRYEISSSINKCSNCILDSWLIKCQFLDIEKFTQYKSSNWRWIWISKTSYLLFWSSFL